MLQQTWIAHALHYLLLEIVLRAALSLLRAPRAKAGCWGGVCSGRDKEKNGVHRKKEEDPSGPQSWVKNKCQRAGEKGSQPSVWHHTQTPHTSSSSLIHKINTANYLLLPHCTGHPTDYHNLKSGNICSRPLIQPAHHSTWLWVDITQQEPAV